MSKVARGVIFPRCREILDHSAANLKKGLASLAVGIALTALASPSYAQEGHFQISRERAQALHECSLRAARYPQYLWGNQEIYTYRACMAEHGQQE